ncbi:efflux RND transporter periplasmic adaptor subunit [Flavobacterium sp. NG2]|uniref:efflux RND transporter periplasmic adaptor subunit n=1 Tax=Flavobacterium sp. NG2 TaxID=3097547 RepID=UPI002A80ACC6|nr:efflux RND transporter periplasmic adaptor subunit [Flavobacterium sp. NG2]WPR72758.1 efflux RND transporter periplasmic adaptor subunit [Flavobacterium sp. NG2]
MKILRNIGFVMLLFVALACNDKKEGNQEEHKHQTEEGIYYTCSMDPQVKEDKPGKCPICHMELTPMKKASGNSNEITLSEQQVQLGNITTQKLSETENSVAEQYTAVLSYNQETLKTISARAMGRLEKLYFKTEGDIVHKNQPLYQLYSEDLAIAKQDYYTAYKQLGMPGDFGKNAKTLVQAAQQKLMFYGLSATQIDAIKKTADVSPYTTFYSPISGVISQIKVTEGSYLMEGMGIVELANLSLLWLETQVPVQYAISLKLGQTARVSFVDYPTRILDAKVSFINPEINPDSRLLAVRMEVANVDGQLKPGMQALVQITQSKVKGLFVPTDAVIREEKGAYIWLEKAKGVYENRMIETGLERNGKIEIKTPIDVDEKIVITGAYGINSEYKFRKGSNPMEGHKM